MRTWRRCSDSKRKTRFTSFRPNSRSRSSKRNPHLIGHDPIILVYDLYAPANRKSRGYRGFRLNLGLIKHPEQALARLQEFLRFVAVNRTAVPLGPRDPPRALSRRIRWHDQDPPRSIDGIDLITEALFSIEEVP